MLAALESIPCDSLPVNISGDQIRQFRTIRKRFALGIMRLIGVQVTVLPHVLRKINIIEGTICPLVEVGRGQQSSLLQGFESGSDATEQHLVCPPRFCPPDERSPENQRIAFDTTSRFRVNMILPLI